MGGSDEGVENFILLVVNRLLDDPVKTAIGDIANEIGEREVVFCNNDWNFDVGRATRSIDGERDENDSGRRIIRNASSNENVMEI